MTYTFALFFLGFLLIEYAKSEKRIIGGIDASIEFYPYQISLQHEGKHVCGGAIISNKYGLTAAHCLVDVNPKRVSVRVGSTMRKDGLFYYVTNITKHEKYNPATEEYDLAIIQFEKSLNFTNSIQPIALQESKVEVPEGTSCWISGWGSTAEGSDVPNDHLKAATVTVVSMETCKSRYGPNQITPKMLCAQGVGEDACHGDSGGPLVVSGRLVGILAWGFGCARPQYPGVYTKISEVQEWITSHL